MVALRDSSQMFAKFLFPTTFVGDNVATFSVGRTVIDGKASSCSHSANFEFGFFLQKKKCAVSFSCWTRAYYSSDILQIFSAWSIQSYRMTWEVQRHRDCRNFTIAKV